jgi:hypothetical protein
VLNGEVARAVAANPHWLDEQLVKIAEQLGATKRWVYASRDKGFDPEAPPEAPPVPPPPEVRA